jgi:hypothetical protein
MGVTSTTCASCGAVLAETDRFCPACDVPNTSKPFPKFRPHVADLREEGDPVRVPAGAVCCPRCSAVLRFGDTFCAVCGLEVEQVLVRAGREPWVGVWRTPGPHNLDPYRSLHPWAVMLRAVLMLTMVVSGALAALYIAQFDSIGAMPWRKGFGLPRTAALTDVLEVILVGLGVVLVFLALGWTNRAYRNLPAMSVVGLRFAPEIAAAAWVVPGVNLVVPKLILDELWKGSDPDARPRSTAWRAQRAPILSLVAWVVLLAGTALAVMVALAIPDPTAVQPADLQFALAVAAVAYGLVALGGLLLCMLVGQISERQELRAERLGPPKAVEWLHRRDGVLEGEAGDARNDSLLEITLSNIHRATAGPVWGRY